VCLGCFFKNKKVCAHTFLLRVRCPLFSFFEREREGEVEGEEKEKEKRDVFRKMRARLTSEKYYFAMNF
jgi:hypothetical protein